MKFTSSIKYLVASSPEQEFRRHSHSTSTSLSWLKLKLTADYACSSPFRRTNEQTTELTSSKSERYYYNFNIVHEYFL